MKPINRLGGMASLLLLVSLFSPVKASASEVNSPEKEVNASVNDRIAAIHQKLETAEKNLSDGRTRRSCQSYCTMGRLVRHDLGRLVRLSLGRLERLLERLGRLV